ncbi:MAG TPA: hypothetical protein VKC64_18550 [Burkholderiales bacterium]|nr:hypothetical protein [Burkholderiales bacterium]
MRYRRSVPASILGPASTARRRIIGAFGASALGGWLGGCAAPPLSPPRPLDRALAPRVGDTWTYQYSSAFPGVAPRLLEVRVVDVALETVRDRIGLAGEGGGDEHAFTSALEMVERPLTRQVFYDFSPYLQAFGALPVEGAVAWPPPNWGRPFVASARIHGSEPIAVPAGSFAATRMEIIASRAPSPGLQPRIDPVLTYATVWYSPGSTRAVQWRVYTRAGFGNPLTEDLYQLASFRSLKNSPLVKADKAGS